jgi:hypothetical protein
MTIDRIVFAVAGSLVLLSVVLGVRARLRRKEKHSHGHQALALRDFGG